MTSHSPDPCEITRTLLAGPARIAARNVLTNAGESEAPARKRAELRLRTDAVCMLWRDLAEAAFCGWDVVLAQGRLVHIVTVRAEGAGGWGDIAL